MSEVTRILEAVENGDRQAANELLPLVYDELRKLAAHYLGNENPGQTLQPTALVHEAYLRLVGPANANGFPDRAYFFAAAAQAMRRILVEAARARGRLKRGGDWNCQSLEQIDAHVSIEDPDQILSLDEALFRLAERDSVKARLVELRFFAGLTGDQAAAALGISPSSADRHWTYARAWLRGELTGPEGPENS